jgi:hypothetical protein
MPSGELANTPQFRATMDRLESVKHTAPNGKDLWNAREINAILGYPTWREFEEVIERAKRACSGTGVDPQKHFVPTHKYQARAWLRLALGNAPRLPSAALPSITHPIGAKPQ